MSMRRIRQRRVECGKMENVQDSQGILVASGTKRGLSPAKSDSDQESLSDNQMVSMNPLQLAITDGNGLLIAISIIGGLHSTLMAGFFGDTFGRREILSMARILYLPSACGIALSPTVSILITARFLVGCAYGLSSTIVPLLISETAPSNIRGQYFLIRLLIY
ncbi:hypothetical protein KI387_023425, partial [Taxus chinensis]